MNSSHPTVGLTDTLRKYYAAEQSKAKNKRRKLTTTTATREQAIDDFINATAASDLCKASVYNETKEETSKDQREESTKRTTALTESHEGKTDKKDDGKPLDFAQRDREELEQRERQVQRDMDKIENAKRQVYKDQVELWGVYKYGLQHVKELADLSDAPDAILPGNFP